MDPKKLKSLKCYQCNSPVTNVGEYCTRVTCEECTQKNLIKAVNDQTESEVKGGLTMVEENIKKEKDTGRNKRYEEMTPKILELAKAGKTPNQIKAELGENAPGKPKIARIIASAK